MSPAQHVFSLVRNPTLRGVRRALPAIAVSLVLSACASPYTNCPLPETFDASLFNEVLTPSGDYYPSNLATRTHRIYRPSGTPRPELVVHLPGHGNEPENQTKLPQTAATQHRVTVTYHLSLGRERPLTRAAGTACRYVRGSARRIDSGNAGELLPRTWPPRLEMKAQQEKSVIVYEQEKSGPMSPHLGLREGL